MSFGPTPTAKLVLTTSKSSFYFFVFRTCRSGADTFYFKFSELTLVSAALDFNKEKFKNYKVKVFMSGNDF